MQNYSKIEEFLHDFVLSKKFINKFLYEVEKIIYSKKIQIKDNPHIFITGLPRSGTTSLLNFLYSSNQYASLTYKNIPFVLSPNFSKIFSKKDILKKERIHGDGIFYDINSPEAFDEIFFNLDEEFVKDELLNYLQLICLSQNKTKYISKNNLNYIRIDLISLLLPNSIFLIPIRQPLQQAYSLLRQHLNFTQLHKEDDFIKRYMNYLGHNEFGVNHKSWNPPINFQDFNKIDYWLEQWFLFYQNIFNSFHLNKNCHFVIYEELRNPTYLETFLKKIKFNKIKDLNLNYFKNSNKSKIDLNVSKDIYVNSHSLYNKFKNKFSIVL